MRGLTLSRLALLAATALIATPAAARDVVPLTQGWRFAFGAPAAEAMGAQDSATFRPVAVPHNWNRLGGTTIRTPDRENIYGAGWYRLRFPTPAKAKGQRAFLEFDAASIVTEVWLNGQRLGSHAGSFQRFRFDATAAMKPSGDNLLVVKVDNSKPETPGSPTAEVIPMSGDFPMYGGLYRPVSLVLADAVHVALDDHGGPGVYARTVSASPDAAQIAVETRLTNANAAPAPVKITTTILDADGRTRAERIEARTLPRGRDTLAVTLPMTKPRLWDGMADPYLHRVRVDVRAASGQLLDRVEVPLGIRTFRIDADTGFYLNGRHLPLHGVSRHQDRPVRGWVITDADQDEDMALMKEMGANTVRLAHYQHADAAYERADRAGMVSWAEIPLVDRTKPFGAAATTPGFAANARSQLVELIRQTYNHPSIVVWSIGNEVNLEAARKNDKSDAVPLLRQLQRVAHAEDPSRPTTLADCCGANLDKRTEWLDNVMGITDVVGVNRYHGWYRPDVYGLAPDLADVHARYPRQPLSISEYGAGGALTQHTDDPRGGPIASFGRPHPEEYQSWMLEESWKQIAPLRYIWASWVWNMFDFSNEQRLEGDLVDTNDKGLVTFDRKTKKDAFYFYKANWTKTPFVHITSKRYVDRPYGLIEVKAYTPLPSATLSLNGREIGAARCEWGTCVWKAVALTPGENALTVRAGDQQDRSTIRFVGAPDRWLIRAGTLTGGMAKDGRMWGSDVYSTGGQGHFRDLPSLRRGTSPAPIRPVAGTDDQVTYESWRSGKFSYAVPVAPSRYRVTLHFFEPEDTPPQRRFDVLAEGTNRVAALDVATAAGGARRALVRSFDVDVKDRTLDLAFVPQTGDAIVSAIAIEPR